MPKPTFSPHYGRVAEFMKLAGQDTPLRPIVPDLETRKLRAKLILEEALETVFALGFIAKVGDFSSPYHDVQLTRNDDGVSLVEIIDGCCDVAVVTTGTLIACGITDEDALKLVDENNLAKFGPGSYRREDGKWMKPPGHTKPDFQQVIDALNA